MTEFLAEMIIVVFATAGHSYGGVAVDVSHVPFRTMEACEYALNDVSDLSAGNISNDPHYGNRAQASSVKATCVSMY